MPSELDFYLSAGSLLFVFILRQAFSTGRRNGSWQPRLKNDTEVSWAFKEVPHSDGSSKGCKGDFGWPGLDTVFLPEPITVAGVATEVWSVSGPSSLVGPELYFSLTSTMKLPKALLIFLADDFCLVSCLLTFAQFKTSSMSQGQMPQEIQGSLLQCRLLFSLTAIFVSLYRGAAQSSALPYLLQVSRRVCGLYFLLEGSVMVVSWESKGHKGSERVEVMRHNEIVFKDLLQVSL